MFSGHWSSASKDKKYLAYHVTLQNHMIKGSSNFMRGGALQGISPLWRFSGHRYYITGDIKFLVSRVIKKDHKIKGPGDYNDRSLLR